MKKRILAILICTLLTASLFSPAVYAQESGRETVKQSTLQAKVKTITPSITLSKTVYTWNGKAKRPSVTVKAGSNLLKKGTDYTVSYKNNINVGKATVTVTLKGKYKGKKSVSFKIRPMGTKLTGLSKSAEVMTVKWEKQSAKMSKERISGYQIQLAADKQFTKSKKTVKVEGYQHTSKKIKGLKINKKYYVRIRTYKIIGESTFYSSWSEIKCKKDASPEPTPIPSDLTLMLTETDEAMLDAMAETQVNAIISPVSINLCLSMLLEGANGQTQTELENYLGVKKDELDQYVGTIWQSTADEEKLKVLISNAFWYRPDQIVNEDYKATLAQRYAAEISDLDFSNPITAAEVINGWCKKKTNGLIPSIVAPDVLTDAADVLLNTLYFKNDWAEQVDKYNIKEGTFHGFNQDVDVTYLHSEEFIGYENDKAIAFEKLYNKNYSFIGILPKSEGDFTISELDISGLIQNRIAGYDALSVTMPKFTIDSGGIITEILYKMGLETVLTPAADFSGIAENLYISDVIHKTKVILDENGTEAAAATAAVAKESAFYNPKILEITLDRPYAFMIVDRSNGAVLFMGKVCVPKE